MMAAETDLDCWNFTLVILKFDDGRLRQRLDLLVRGSGCASGFVLKVR